MLLGGHGVISVTANVAPKLMHQMCAAALVGDVKRAREINLRLLPLHQHLFVEANPIPVKWALAEMGLIEHGLRLPLVAAVGEVPPARCARRCTRRASRSPGCASWRAAAEMQQARGAFAAAAAALLAGCSTLDVRQQRSTTRPRRKLPPLEVPPDLTAPARDNRFVAARDQQVGDALGLPAAERKEQAPPGATGVLPQVENVRLERAGTERWLVVQEPPEQGVAGGAGVLAGERLPASSEECPRPA